MVSYKILLKIQANIGISMAVTLILLILSSCGSQKKLLKSEQTEFTQEITSTQYKEILRDTVIVFIPAKEEKERAVKQDSSYLETSLALSTAKIGTDGILYHTLKNKETPIPIFTQVKDSKYSELQSIKTDNKTYIEVPVPNQPSKLQKWLQVSGVVAWIAIVTLMIYSAFRLRRKILLRLRK